MGFRLDSPLSKIVGLCFATLAGGYVVFRQALGLSLDGFGTDSVGIALGIFAVVVLGVLMITTDNAFEG